MKYQMTSTFAYLRAGIDPLGAIPTYATMMPTAHPTPGGAQPRMPRTVDPPYLAPLLTRAAHRPHTDKVLGLKSNADLVAHVPATPSPMAGVSAPSFNVRHQKKGLAYDPQKPVGKIAPQADNQYASLNSKIPVPT